MSLDLSIFNPSVFPFVHYDGYPDGYPTTSTLAMTSADVAQLDAVAAESWRTMTELTSTIADDQLAVATMLGDKFAGLISSQPANSQPSVIARLDFLKTLDGEFKLIEVNADTPTAIIESFYGNRVACESLGLTDVNAGYVDHLRSVLRRFEGPVAFAAERAYPEEFATAKFLANLAGSDLVVDLADVRVFDDHVGVRLNGEVKPVKSLYLLHPKEWLVSDVDVHGYPTGRKLLELSASGRVNLINPNQALLMQHKGLLAIASAVAPHLTPLTRIHPLDRRQVRKPVFGREGFGVTIHPAGDVTGDGVAVYQEFLPTAKVDVETELDRRSGWLTYSKFVIDGKVSATYVRFSPDLICALDAYWVPVNLT